MSNKNRLLITMLVIAAMLMILQVILDWNHVESPWIKYIGGIGATICIFVAIFAGFDKSGSRKDE